MGTAVRDPASNASVVRLPHAAAVCVVTACLPALAQPPATVPPRDRTAEASGKRLVVPAAQAAIDRGLAWLAARQHEDGSFWSGSPPQYRRDTAVTALAGLAFLSSGSLPNRGPYGENVERAVRFLVASAQPSGMIFDPESTSHGPMYGHGFATLFLAEAYGTAPEERVRKTLAAAVRLIIASQNEEGGWRYHPDAVEADISVTVSQIMALRAARNCGFAVPKETIDRGLAYVRKCQNPDGGFMYQLTRRGESAFPRSAAGVVALFSAGIYEGDEVDRGVSYLARHAPQPGVFRYQSHYYYGHYYAAQAMWQTGGRHWERWYPAARDELLAQQRSDGRWPDPTVCDEYGTAMALLVLQMPNNVLPIFQR